MADIAPITPDLVRRNQWTALVAGLPSEQPPAPTPVKMAMPNPVPQMGALPPLTVTSAPHVPTQTEADTAKLNSTVNAGAGVDHIANPVLHGIAKVGNVFGTTASTLFPALRPILSAIPGTTENFNRNVGLLRANVANDQQRDLATAQVKDAEAQATQRQALADQETAKAQALLNPQAKAVPGHLILSGDGSAAGYQDGDGNLHGLNDPETPQGARDVAANMAPKAAKVPTAEQPIDADEAKARNAIYDPLAQKHGLPTGQFTAGMTRKEVNDLAANMNSVVGKQQGDTHIVIQQQGQAQKGKLALSRSGPVDLTTPESQEALAAAAKGDTSLTELLPRNATFEQRAAVVSAIKAINPAYNSGDHQIENHLRNYMIAGKGGQTLTAFNTTQAHLGVLRQAADALHNGDVTAFNSLSQQYAKATGSPAPTNFDAVKNAVKGEVSRALTGNVTVSEQAELDKDFNNASSPQQVAGVAQKYTQLIEGKKAAMRDTYNAGQQGQVNFGDSGPKEGDTKTNSHGDKVVYKGGKWGPA